MKRKMMASGADFRRRQTSRARLDRLGLRPLRTVETGEYLAVMSEAGK